MKPLIAVPIGDPAGIGPEIVVSPLPIKMYFRLPAVLLSVTKR